MGVIGFFFDLVVVGVGIFNFDYFYMDGNGCIVMVFISVLVSVLVILFFFVIVIYCVGENVVLNIIFGNGILGIWNLVIVFMVVVGISMYNFILVVGQCVIVVSMVIIVNVNLVVMFDNVNDFCVYNVVVIFVGILFGGIFFGIGVIGILFNLVIVGIGMFMLIYFYIDGNGCFVIQLQDVMVDQCFGLEENIGMVVLVYLNLVSDFVYVVYFFIILSLKLMIIDGKVVYLQ